MAMFCGPIQRRFDTFVDDVTISLSLMASGEKITYYYQFYCIDFHQILLNNKD